jgi:cyclic-di-GMP phosphodiesterase TipF (flagellum assembly factor)
LNPRGKKFSDAVIAEMVRHAVRQQKVEMFVQPVVSLPQRQVRMVELFGRIKGRSGIYLAAERYMKVAANDALVPSIDDRLLRTALEALKSPFSGIAPGVSIMLNIEAKTLGNATFMKDLTGFLAADKHMARRIVFELAQTELDAMPTSIMPVVQALSQLGVRFSMDCVRSRRLNMTLIKKLGIRFVKMNAAWLMREAQSEGGSARINRLKGQLDAAGIDLIVERIEDESELRELLDFNIDYGQGFLFGKPELYAVWRDRQAKPKPGAVA